MITITTFEIASDFESIDLVIDAGVGNTFTSLLMYVGDEYLSENEVDLTSMLAGTQEETLSISIADLGLTDVEELVGIFTMYAVASDASTKEAAIANLYYINLCLANMIVNKEATVSFDELNSIYLLIKAIGIYLPLNKIEEALNAYDKVLAMCEKSPTYLLDDDLTPCESGSGCWIINGTYIIN